MRQLCYLISVLGILTVGVDPTLVVHYETKGESSTEGKTTTACNESTKCETSEFILNSLNLTSDPCINFYEFACGGWIRNHPVPPSQPYQNQFHIVENRLRAQLKEILEKDDPNDLVPVRAASLYYRSCTDEEKIQSDSMPRLLKLLLDQGGGWPMAIEDWNERNFDWLQMAWNLARRWFVMPLVYVYVGLDRLDSNHSIITIGQPTSILPQSMLVNHDAYKVQLEAYRQWIAASALSVAKSSNQNVSLDTLEKQSRDILTFEIKLAKLKSTPEMQRNPFRTYNRMTIRDLQEWTNSALLTTDQKSINWLLLIKNIFVETDMSIDYQEPIIVKEVDMLFHLTKLIAETPSVILANYLHWRFVAAISRDITNEMRTYVKQFEEVYLGTALDEPRWKDCVASVSSMFNFAVGYKYVQKYFDNTSKIAAEEMMNNILSVFTDELNRTEWMDEKTKSSAITKLSSMYQFIGYPQWFANDSALSFYYDGVTIGTAHLENVEFMRKYLYKKTLLKLKKKTDRSEWLTGPAVVNAFNNGYLNAIILPAGILQPPFFDVGRNGALNYGSIGAIIGHEILHGFDDTGHLLDKYGNLVQWWSEDVIAAYKNKSQCYVNQYSRFAVPSLNSSANGTNLLVDGIMTQDENIADNNGLRQSYLAYQRYIRKQGPEQAIHGLEKFTSDQLFFISYALTWCESSTEESVLRDALTDAHSPNSIRVIGTLSNSAEFSAAFKCPVNSPMNPQIKCVIW